MKRFENNQRVVVASAGHVLNGMAGTVKRLRIGGDGAWVEMAGSIPDELRKFPADDSHGRGNHVLLFPEDCEPTGADK